MNRRSLAINLLLLAVSLVAAAGAAELCLRAFVPQDLGIWSLTREGLIIHLRDAERYLPEHGTNLRTNSLGMRDREHARQKPPGALRILVLGDSFVEALQVEFEDSFSAVLEQRLSGDVSPPVEVLSAGVSGWGTDDQLTFLRKYGAAFHPDLVLIGMTLYNDVSDNLEMEFRHFENGHLTDRPRADLPWRRYATQFTRATLSAHSHLYRLLYRSLRAPEFRREARALRSHVADLLLPGHPGNTGVGWDMTYALLDETVAFADSIGARTAVFLIPMAMQISDPLLDSFLEAHDLTRDEISLDEPQRMARAWGDRSGTPVIDLLPVFQEQGSGGADTLYVPDGHWSAAGHRLAADEVAHALVGRGIAAELAQRVEAADADS